MKQGRIIAETGKPLQFLWAEEVDLLESAEQTNVALIADTLKVYRQTTDDLLKGKYACFADIVPRHLKSPCDIFVLRCSDGVLVRYDTTTQENPFIRAAVVDNSLRDMAFQFSEGILRLDTDPQDLRQDKRGLALSMGVMDTNGAMTQTHMLLFFILASSQLPVGFQLPNPPARPVCLVSLQSEFELEIGGHLAPVDITQRPDGSDDEQFIAHSRVQLPIGWLAIEVYPLLKNEYWQPEFAPMWAELDILAAAAQQNFSRETQLNALDSRGERRRYYAALLDEFDRLLQGPEEPIHQFLRKHPELICPTYEKYWSKLPFGSRVSDFVFREPYND